MTNDELIASHTIRVNSGSGVLVSALSQDYSYVLTAGHVLGADIELKDRLGQPLRVIDFHPHPDADCAIIQVEYVREVSQATWPAASLQDRANLTLIGFPKSNIGTETPIKIYKGHLASLIDNLIVCNLDGIPGQSSIIGMSGGGIYHLHNNLPYLVGIEYRMDDEDEEARYGRVRCYPLSRFDEIIEANGLAQMVPSFLECFSRLREHIFGYNVIEPQSVKNLQDALWGMADELVRRGLPAPYTLMQKYKGDLLVSSGRPNEIQDRELWEAYFEYLIICALIDDVDIVDDAYIESLERKRRILYTSDDTNWIRRLDEILKAAKRMLDENGTLIVSSPEGDPEKFPPKSKVGRIIKNIASIPTTGSFLKIDNAENSIYESFILTHLKALRKSCVVLNEDEFAATEPGTDQLLLFRDFYNEVIK